MKIFGLATLKNGLQFDYCFQESLRSLANIADCIYLNLGDSEDQTTAEVEKLNIELQGKMKLLPKAWPEMKDGLVLSHMVNWTLKHIRGDHPENQDAWVFYLQADEVISEQENFISELKQAHDSGYDALRFRYLHFWKSHKKICIGEKWYPQEIRAFKLNSLIESWGDAQGFRQMTKVFESNKMIFHYGHVRREDLYEKKMHAFNRLYYEGLRLKRKDRFVKRRRVKGQKTLTYLGPHPQVMNDRIQLLEPEDPPPLQNAVYIKAHQELFSPQLIAAIQAKEVFFIKTLREVPKKWRQKTIIFSPNLLEKIVYPSQVKEKSESPLCHPWTDDFKLILKLSEKHYRIKSF